MTDHTPESAAVKKARQRAAKRAAGLVEVSVWVAPDQVEALRAFAASLPAPARPVAEDADQMRLF